MFLMGKELDRDEDGSTALEYALVIPLFFLLFFAALDVIKILLAEEQLNILARELSFHYKYVASLNDRNNLASADLAEKAKELASPSASFLIEKETLSASSNVYADLSDYVSDLVDTEAGLAGEAGMFVVYRLGATLTLTSPLMILIHGRAVPIHAMSVSKNVQ